LSAILALANCTWNQPQKVVTKTEYIKPNIQVQPHPRPVTMRDVKFYVVTEANFEQFKKDFNKDNGQFVFVAMSVKDYEDLSLNLADIRRYLQQQKQIIVYYEKAVK
jgi:hypothetical protein